MKNIKLVLTALAVATTVLTGCKDDGADHFLGEWSGSNDRATVNLEITSHERGYRIQETAYASDSDDVEELNYVVEAISETELINGNGDDRIRFSYDEESDTITEAASFLSRRLETTYERQ